MGSSLSRMHAIIYDRDFPRFPRPVDEAIKLGFPNVYLMIEITNWNMFFSHTFVEKIEKSIHLLPVCKLYPTLLALLSHTASSVAYEG